jgi:DNA-nicking Smr family endonuclease
MEVQITYSPLVGVEMRDWSDGPAAATFDLHGQTVSEGAANAERFLRSQARVRRGAVVRLITGRGRSGGRAPLRTRVRTLLRALQAEGTVVRDYVLEESEGSFLVRLAG